MCKLYETLNKIFYRFAQMLFLCAVVAVPSGIVYLIFASAILKLDSNEIFANNIFIYYILYVLTALITGSQIAKKYEKYKLKDNKEFKESKFFEFNIDIKR